MANQKDALVRAFGWQCKEFLRLSIAYYKGTGFTFVAALYADLLQQCDETIVNLQGLLENPLQAAMRSGLTATQISEEIKRVAEFRTGTIHEVYRRFKLDHFRADYQATIIYWAKNGTTLGQFFEKQGDHHDKTIFSSAVSAAGYGCAVERRDFGLDNEIQSQNDKSRGLESAVCSLQQRFHRGNRSRSCI